MSSARPSREGAWSNRSHDGHVTYLPLVDSEGRLLPIHFLTEQEVQRFKNLRIVLFSDCLVVNVMLVSRKAKCSIGSFFHTLAEK